MGENGNQTQVSKALSEFACLLLAWAPSAFREFPWRRRGIPPYEVLIAELLLKRTTARAAARAFPEFLEQYPDLASLGRAPIDELSGVLRPVGLYTQRAVGLKALAGVLMEKHGGSIPASFEELSALPHVGPYTARAVLSFAFDVPSAVVDSNVVRVLGRVFRDQLGPTPRLSPVQELATALLPEPQHMTFNWALLDLGSTVCRYVRPACTVCPLTSICDSSL